MTKSDYCGPKILCAALVAVTLASTGGVASAGQITGTGVILLPAATSGSAGFTANGTIENMSDGTTDESGETQNTTFSAPGSSSYNVFAETYCSCAVPGYTLVYTTASANGSVAISYLPNPSLHVTGNLLVGSAIGTNANATVDAEIDYDFTISDKPGAHSQVPIRVNAAGGYTYAVNTPGYEEFLTADVNTSFFLVGVVTNQIERSAQDPGGFGSGSESWSNTDTYMLTTNERYEVRLVAYFDVALLGNEGGGGQTVSVYVDPTFAFADEADAKQYSLLFSDGIGNSLEGAVPEAPTWALLALGFCGVGIGARIAGPRARAA